MLAMAAVCVGLAALAAGTFVLSYSGIHALALHAGVAPRLARGYPLLIDAMLVIVLAAVLALRGADLPSKLLAWTTLMAVLAAAAGADALHAAGHSLPDHAGAIIAAVLPWVLLFLAFALLLAMLRHARLRRLATARSLAAGHGDALPLRLPGSQQQGAHPSPTTAAIVPGLESPVRQPQRAPALPLDPEADAGLSSQVVQPSLTGTHPSEPSRAADTDAAPGSLALEQTELAVDAEATPDDPSSDEAAAGPADRTEEQASQVGQADEADQARQAGDHDDHDDPEMPMFHRMWSPPTPPEPLA
jgi:hypothetical protein